MKGLIQRVSEACVYVNQEKIGEINTGILLLLGVERNDSEDHVDRMLHKILNYRIFPDSDGKMNQSLLDIQGELLVVSQFTLAADTKKGLRPGFSAAAEPALAENLYLQFVDKASQQVSTATGRFAADMQVSLINDGPVTFHIDI